MNEKISMGGSPEKNKKLRRAGGSDRYPRYEFSAESESDELLEESVSPESEMTPELSKPQRKLLRSTLLALGIALTPMKDSNRSEAAFEDGYKVPDGGAEVMDDRRSKIEAGNEIKINKKTHEVIEAADTGEQALDAFSTEVLQYTAEIKDADVAKTWEYAMKPVVGAPEFSRWEYVRNATEFAPWDEEKKTGVPPVIVDELRRLLPGLAGQESRFDASRVSKSGAQGIMQFLPKTWESYGGKPEEMISLKRQIEVAGEFISDLYRQLRVHIGEETLDVLQSRFDSEEDFLSQVMAPLILNAYNAGAMRVGVAVREYVEQTEVEAMPTSGRDLFIAIADFANNAQGYLAKYQQEAREYVPKVYAMTDRLESVIAEVAQTKTQTDPES